MKRFGKKVISILLIICMLMSTVPFSFGAAAETVREEPKIASGSSHSAFIDEDDNLWTWGDNRIAQLGDDTMEDSLRPVYVMEKARAVYVDKYTTLLLKTDNTLWLTGSSIPKSSTGTYSRSFTKLMDNVQAAAIKDGKAAVVKTDGSLWVWGKNTNNSLWDNDQKYITSPLKVMEGVEEVYLGLHQNFAIKKDKSLWGWGKTLFGFFGEVEDNYAPRKLMDNVKEVAAGVVHALILDTNDVLWGWGNGSQGVLTDKVTGKAAQPVKLMEDVKSIAATWMNSAALKNNGELYVWGLNDAGQIGNGAKDADIKNPTPVSTSYKALSNVNTFALGDYQVLAEKQDKTLWVWGNNANGQLGDGTTVAKLSPSQLSLYDFFTVTFEDFDGTVLDTQTIRSGSAATPPPSPERDGYVFTGWDKNFSKITSDLTVTAKYSHKEITFLDYDGTVIAAFDLNESFTAPVPTRQGYIFTGWDKPLGNITTRTILTAQYEIDIAPTNMSAGNSNSLYIDENGTLWGWGDNQYGSVGDGSDNTALLPKAVMEDVKAVSAGYYTSAAIKNDGSLWVWGESLFGRTGVLTPQKVMDDVKTVSVSEFSIGAVKTDGSLWTWGKDVLTPTKVLENVKSVSVYKQTFMAIKEDNSLWAWGENKNGTVGNGQKGAPVSSPVKVLEDVAYVDNDLYFSAAIKTDGSLWLWGKNIDSVFLTTTKPESLTPMKIMDSNVRFVSLETYAINILTADDNLYCWGTTVEIHDEDGMRTIMEPTLFVEDVHSFTSDYWRWFLRLNDGTFKSWGFGMNGELGDGSTDWTYSPGDFFLGSRHQVNFMDYSNRLIGHVFVDDGDSVSAPPQAPARTGYSFTGWDHNLQNITSSLNVTAQYTPLQYTVSFVDHDSTPLKTETVDYSTSATPPANPTRVGYEFVGWDKDYSSVKSELTVTAVYSKIDATYTATFVDYNGVVLASQSDILSGAPATAPADPEREGYTFSGWDKDFSALTGNIVITAQYTPIMLTVTFQDHDGETLATREVQYGQAAVAPENPERYGHRFTHWDRNFSVVKESMVVTAKYTELSYIVYFMDKNGDLLKKQTIKYGEDATPPEPPVIEGERFIGWSEDYTNVTEDLHILAQYETSEFSVSFVDYDGTVLDSKVIARGEDATTNITPRRIGYDFIGWDKPLTNILENTVFTALYKVKTDVEVIEVEGDYNLNGGYIADNLIILANNVTIQYVSVAGNITISGNNVTLRGFSMAGSLEIKGPNVLVESGSIAGNLTIFATNARVNNVNVNGKTIIDEAVGDGEVTFSELKATENDVVIRGGGSNSVHFINSVINNIVIDKAGDAGSELVRVAAHGRTSIEATTVTSGAIIDNTSCQDGTYGISNIVVPDDVQANATLSIKGNIDSLEISGSNISPVLDGGNVNTLTLSENAENVEIKGDGSVSTAIIPENAKDQISFDNAPSNTIKMFSITASAGAGGSITPSGETTIKQGKSLTYIIVPNSGYTLSDIKLDNVSVTPQSPFTLTDIQANHTVEAIFKANTTNPITPPGGEPEGPGVDPGEEPGEEPSEPEDLDKPILHKFTDIANHWSRKNIEWAYGKALFTGVSDTSFAPEGLMERAMLVTVLWRFDGKPATPTGGANFGDVPARQYYAEPVRWASKNEIVNGVADGVFSPNGHITREQLAAILFRYAEMKKLDTTQRTDISSFSDADKISDYAQAAMSWAVASGIITGKSQNKLDPAGNATRAEVAAMIKRFADAISKQK